MKIREERDVIWNILFLIAWPTKVHTNYNLLSPNSCEVNLNDIIHGDVQHFVTFDREIEE